MQQIIAQLTAQLGLKKEQIEAGAGAILNLVKEKIPQAEFQQLLGKLPGANDWLAKAQALPATAQQTASGLLGQASNLLGSLTGNAQGGLAALLSQLEKAGFKADSAMQFVPALLNQIKAAVGPEQLNKLLAQVPALKDAASGMAADLLGKLRDTTQKLG